MNPHAVFGGRFRPSVEALEVRTVCAGFTFQVIGQPQSDLAEDRATDRANSSITR